MKTGKEEKEKERMKEINYIGTQFVSIFASVKRLCILQYGAYNVCLPERTTDPAYTQLVLLPGDMTSQL